MSFEVKWYIPSRVIYVCAAGTLREQEALALISEVKILMESGTPPLYIVSDETQLDSIDIPLAAIREPMNLFTDERIGYIAALSTKKSIVLMIINLLTKLYNLKVKRFDDLETLHQFLKDYDATLDFG